MRARRRAAAAAAAAERAVEAARRPAGQLDATDERASKCDLSWFDGARRDAAALKLLLVHSRDDLSKSNFVVAMHKGVGRPAAARGDRRGLQFIFVRPSHIQHGHIRLFARRIWSVINQFGAEIPFRLRAGSESIGPSYELLFWVLYHSSALLSSVNVSRLHWPRFIRRTRSICHSFHATNAYVVRFCLLQKFIGETIVARLWPYEVCGALDHAPEYQNTMPRVSQKVIRSYVI